MNEFLTSETVHYYAGWPGKALCEGKTSLPVMPITSIRSDHVTCEQCREILYQADYTLDPVNQPENIR